MAVNNVLRWVCLLGALTTGCATSVPHAEAGAGSAALKVAQKMVGKPYRYGGSSPTGFDCSGLVHYSFTKVGYPAPRETSELFYRTRSVHINSLKPGDLLFFRIDGKVSHVAMYVSNDTFVHAPSSGKAVAYGTLSNPYWKERLVKVGRL